MISDSRIAVNARAMAAQVHNGDSNPVRRFGPLVRRLEDLVVDRDAAGRVAALEDLDRRGCGRQSIHG